MANRNRDNASNRQLPSDGPSRSIDWYSEGDSRVVEIGGICIEVCYVGRKGRRGRIAIVAPPGSSFRDSTAITPE